KASRTSSDETGQSAEPTDGASPDSAKPSARSDEPSVRDDSGARPADDQAGGRLTVRLSENKAAFGNKVVLSLIEIDSLENEIIVRMRQRDGAQRTARSLSPGDLFEFELDDGKHSLYLDQIKGNLAFFIMDGLPVEPSGRP
ncbi:MAG: hypothetical protein LBJ64_07185, partial [Deltaproteobacteria bacterium]|nr:hypothetical protein [Deltaproteobacteria bacterium]